MIFNINKDRLTIDTREEQLSGSINYYESVVNYSAEWNNLTIEAVLVEKDGKQGIPLAVINNKVFIDSKFDGIYYIGFVGFLSGENNEKIYQISTDLQPIRFRAGAGSIELKIKELPTINEWERYIMQIQEFINESKDVVAQAENLNLEVVKEQNCAILTITRKDKLEEQVYIYDGQDYILTEEDKTNIVEETKAQIDEELSETLASNLAEAKNYSDSNLNKAKTYSNENLEKAKTYSNENLEKAKAFSNSNLELSKEYSDNKLKEAKEYSDNTKPTKTSELVNDSNFAKTNQNNNFSTSQTITGTLTVEGDIIQNGNSYITHAEELYTQKDEIVVRDGAVGGLGEGAYTGILAKKYDGDNDGRLGFNANGEVRVGDVGDEQPLLTRDEITNLQEGQVLVWDDANLRAVGSDNFVKNTDWATSATGGIVKLNAAYGINRNTANNNLYINAATNAEIDAKTNVYKPIVPSNLEYAVKSVGDGHYVTNTDYATASKAGIVKPAGSLFIDETNNDTLLIAKATETLIDGKADNYHPIVPANLDYAVKSVGDGYYVKNTDYVTSAKAGIVAIGSGTGIWVNHNNALYVAKATNAEIDAKTSEYKPIVPSSLDYAVGTVKASEVQSGTAKMWVSINEDGEMGLNISTEA